MNVKIELKSGYSEGFLPEQIKYKNYTMLVAIANYSDNNSCSGTASTMVEEIASMETKERLLAGLGGFMTAVCLGTFAEAWKRADGSNRKALIEGLTNNEIEL